MALNYDTLAASTLQHIRPRMADTIFKANPTVHFMLEKGRVKTVSGGKWIEEPLMYTKNGNISSYRGYDPLNVAPTEELTMAKYNWRQAAGALSISGLETDIQNSGPEQVFSMLKTKLKVLEMSFREWLDEMIHATTASKDLSRDFLGLREIVPAAVAASQGTLGGIDKNQYSWWANQYNNPTIAAALTTRPLTQEMITFLNTCSKGLSKPNIIITNQTLYERYEKENFDLLRLDTNDRQMLDVGFVGQRFKGIPMFWNEHLGAENLMYFLNMEYLNFTLASKRNFAMTPFVKPHNQDAKVAHVLLAGNMTCNNCRFQGVLNVTIS